MLTSESCLIFLIVCLNYLIYNCNAIEVTTSSGTVRGQTMNVVNHKVNQWLNIPYAEPPVGSLRFAPPVPLKRPKKDVIDGTVLGNSCIQYQSPEFVQFMGKLATSEDCLTLTVWAPDGAQNLPVMFWIYGGGLSSGSIYSPIYNASVLATNGVILVAANYRLGHLGFLYGADETAPGNAGFYDQVLAIKWVRENIHLFGGNKDKITIFGESSGSWSVSAHILSPQSKGLFSRAIMQSGFIAYNKDRPVMDTVRALSSAKDLALNVGCDPYDYKWLQCLRAVEDPDKFIVGPDSDGGALGVTYGVYGTEFLPQMPQKILDSNQYNSDIDLMAGVTKDEGATSSLIFPLLRDNFDKNKLDQMMQYLNNEYHNLNTEKLLSHYIKNVNQDNPKEMVKAFNQIYGDLMIICPTYKFAKRFAGKQKQSNVYFYRWNWSSKQMSQWGCDEHTICHGEDVLYVFGGPVVAQQMFSETDYDFSLEIMKMWTDFAKTGKPNNVWPKLLDPSDMNGVSKVKDLNPNDMSIVLDNPYDKTCDGVWSEYF